MPLKIKGKSSETKSSLLSLNQVKDYGTILESMVDPTFAIDANQNVIHFNKSFIQYSKINSKELRKGNQPYMDCLPLKTLEDEVEKNILEMAREKNKPFMLREVSAESKHGESLSFTINVTPLTSEGDEVSGCLVAMRDLSAEAGMQGKFKGLYEKEKELTEQLKKANDEITQWNKELELKVSERTAELQKSKSEVQRILNNMEEGLCTINEELKIAPEYSEKMHQLLGKNLAGQYLPDLLNLDGDELENFKILSQLAFKGESDWPTLESLLPEKVVKNNRVLRLAYKCIYGEEEKKGTIISIMVSITDISDKIALEEKIIKAKKKQDQINRRNEAIINVLVNPNPFPGRIRRSLAQSPHFSVREDFPHTVPRDGGYFPSALFTTHLIK